MRRIVTILVLALTLHTGCSDPPTTGDGPVIPPEADAWEPRERGSLAPVDPEALANRIRTLGVPEDRARDTQSCLDGDMDACESMSDDYLTGRGVKKDPATTQLFYDFGRQLAEASCTDDGARTDGCAHLGRMHFEGRGVRLNRDWGIKLLRRGCAGGDDFACVYLEDEGIPETAP